MKTVPLPDDLERPARVEGVFHDHAAAGQQAEVRGERQAVDVEQRQDVDQRRRRA